MGGKVLSAGVLLGVCWSGSWLLMGAEYVRTQSPWLTDFEKAFAEAKSSRKPVFVVFRCEH
jgi:hypothetical protein